MEIEDYNYEKNSNTISKEERDAFIDRFKRACREYCVLYFSDVSALYGCRRA